MKMRADYPPRRHDMIGPDRRCADKPGRQGQEEVQDGEPTRDALPAHAELNEEAGRCRRVGAM